MAIAKKHHHPYPQPRDLSELEIPEAVPIPWGNPASTLFGVGRAAINSGLKVFIEAYENMALGDRAEVYWDASNASFASLVVDASNLNQRLGLNLPEELFLDGDFQPFYRIKRVSNQTIDSPIREIRVQLGIPGGADPDPSTSHNENLAAPQVPADIQQNGVSAEQAALGVDVTIAPYPSMREYDRIDFSWGGQRQEYILQPAEVNQPLVLHIEEALILAAGDGQIRLMYEVIDAAANRSDGWSLVTQVDVSASGTDLDAPIVVDAVEGELNLASLGGQDVIVQALATSEHFSISDLVELLWSGQTPAGLSVDWSGSKVVTSVPEVLEFNVPNASVMAIAQGSAIVSYVLHKSNDSKLFSKRTQVQVIGSAQLLAPPSVREASNGSLAADVTQATVDIAAYQGMAAGDLVTLIWSGLKASGEPTDYRVERTISGGSVGQGLAIQVPGAAQVAPLDGGSVTLWYQVTPAGRATGQESERLELAVGTAAASLPAPTVLEAENGVLATDVLQATVNIAAYTGMAPNDRVDLFWKGNMTGEFTDWLPVSSGTVGHVLTFTVYPENIEPNSSAQVGYSVARAAGGSEQSVVLQLRIGEALPLPAPSIDQAVGDQLNPADVPNGASVRVAASANLAAGDLLTVHWLGESGAGSGDFERNISGSQAGQDVTVVVPLSVVAANEGSSVELSYDLVRVNGDREVSPVAVYDVRTATGSGRLKVMGARSGLDIMSCYGDLGRRLVALNAETLEPLEAQWQYEGDTTSVTGSSFRDSDPSRLLRVSTGNDEVLLNVANLCGNYPSIAARREEGNLLAWGDTNNGGSIPPTIATLTDVAEVVASTSAFAARRANGTVVAWGLLSAGGEVPSTIATLTDIIRLAGSRPLLDGYINDYAALRRNGAVVAWGGGQASIVPAAISSLTDVIAIAAAKNAFAARRANGSVVAWGASTAGGEVPPHVATLTDIVEVTGNLYAFAARRANGTAVTWGDSGTGGVVPPTIATLTDIVEITGNNVAFTARRANGSVVAWGAIPSGGEVPPTIATLSDIVAVVGFIYGFAALRANGSVVAWGDSANGGSVPPTIATLTDIVALNTSGWAVCALRSGGEVVAWGSSAYGGDTSSVVTDLVDVRAVYAGGEAFAALRADDRVVTWGAAPYGGDSSSVAELLNGHVSYEATPTSRGISR